jgi:hypothetical protein
MSGQAWQQQNLHKIPNKNNATYDRTTSPRLETRSELKLTKNKTNF